MRCAVWELAIKKTLIHPKRNEEARRIFKEKIVSYQQDNRIIIYIDESGFEHDMPRTHGYSCKGKRCFGYKDWGLKSRTNVIGALIGKLILTAMLFKNTIDSDVFYKWVVCDFLPKCPPKSVIVMDNAAFHKRQDIQNAIRNAGHVLLFMPTYSPDLNPIEQKWAEIKQMCKKYGETIEKIFQTKVNHFI